MDGKRVNGRIRDVNVELLEKDIYRQTVRYTDKQSENQVKIERDDLAPPTQSGHDDVSSSDRQDRTRQTDNDSSLKSPDEIKQNKESDGNEWQSLLSR